MHVFLDFEASSLNDDSYPIEVAWVFEHGEAESHLIRPAPAWTDWDPAAEAMHGISRGTLESEGMPHDAVANRILEVLSDHAVFASAPSWDGKWLSVLLRAAGLPRHAIRLKDTEEAQTALARRVLAPCTEPDRLEEVVSAIIAEARAEADVEIVRHRAREDAERERQIWLRVGRLAEERAALFGKG